MILPESNSLVRLRGPFAKLQRADELIQDFQTEINRFFNEERPFDLSIDDHPEDSSQCIVKLTPRFEFPALKWGVRVGEIVHNLRSALDHLVWTLTILNGNTPPNPIPKRSPWRQVTFPIYLEPYPASQEGIAIPWTSEWPTQLWGIDERFRGALQIVQPFMEGPRAEMQVLWILNELWNIDKHRAVNIVDPVVEQILWPVHSSDEGRRIDGSEEAPMRFSQGISIPMPRVDFDPDRQPIVRFQVFLEEGTRYDKMPLMDGLGLLLEGVSRILNNFAPFVAGVYA